MTASEVTEKRTRNARSPTLATICARIDMPAMAKCTNTQAIAAMMSEDIEALTVTARVMLDGGFYIGRTIAR
jgi:hypothetical protein